MDGIITFSKGIVFWTTERMNSDEFILFSLKSYLASRRSKTTSSVPLRANGAVVSENVRVVRESEKKPYLSPRVAEFSLTHTEGFLAVVFSEVPIGIDVENRRRFQKGTQCARSAEREKKQTAENFNATTESESENANAANTEDAAEKRDLCGNQQEIPVYRKIAERFFGISVDDEETFFKLWTKREAETKRDKSFLLRRNEIDKGETEYFDVGDFLIAIAY